MVDIEFAFSKNNERLSELNIRQPLSYPLIHDLKRQ